MLFGKESLWADSPRLVCTVPMCPAGVVRAAAGQMFVCTLVSVRERINHTFVSLSSTVSRENSSTGNPHKLIPLLVRLIFTSFSNLYNYSNLN